MMKVAIGFSMVFAVFCLAAQTPPSKASDPFQSLSFLEGTWAAETPSDGKAPNVIGTYTFRRELKGNIMARHGNTTSCKGPDGFDCEHGDLLYVYIEAPGSALKAIYFDNEGHVIHYSVSTPTAGSAIFLSDPAVPGPQFRLVYELKDKVMLGKFQMHMPGQGDWKSYLEWSGGRK